MPLGVTVLLGSPVGVGSSVELTEFLNFGLKVDQLLKKLLSLGLVKAYTTPSPGDRSRRIYLDPTRFSTLTL